MRLYLWTGKDSRHSSILTILTIPERTSEEWIIDPTSLLFSEKIFIPIPCIISSLYPNTIHYVLYFPISHLCMSDLLYRSIWLCQWHRDPEWIYFRSHLCDDTRACEPFSWDTPEDSLISHPSHHTLSILIRDHTHRREGGRWTRPLSHSPWDRSDDCDCPGFQCHFVCIEDF